MMCTRWAWLLAAILLALPLGTVLARDPITSGGWQVLGAAARTPSFYDPSGLAVGPKGGVIVADTGNNRILRLGPDGRALASWPVQLLPPGETHFHIYRGGSAFRLPSARVAVDPAGNVYVVAPAMSGVRKYAPNGRLLARWAVSAADIAADRHGNVYLLVSGGIQKRDGSGKLLATWTRLSPNGRKGASAQGIAVAPNGEIDVDLVVTVVPDQSQCYRTCPTGYDSYIQRLSPAGRPVTTWHWLGCTEFSGQCIGNPVPMALGSDRSVFIADQDNDRIYRFSPTGRPLGQWGAFGPAPGQLEGALGMAIDGRGRLLVSDAENGRIQGFTAGGRSVLQWGAGSGLGQLNCPVSIAVGPDGTAYAEDVGNGRIQTFSSAGRAVGAWRLGRPLDPAHENACSVPPLNGLVVDRSGNVYAIAPLDGLHIYKFAPSGRLLATLDLGRFSAGSIAIGGKGNLFVSGRDLTANFGFHSLLKLSPSGKVLQAWPATPPADPSSFPVGAIAVDRQAHVYIAEPATSRVWKLSSSFQVLARWEGFAWPDGLAVDRGDNLYVADNGQNFAHGSTARQAVCKLAPDGRRLAQWSAKGSLPGQIHDPAGVAVDPHGRWLYVADTGNNRVQRLAIGR